MKNNQLKKSRLAALLTHEKWGGIAVPMLAIVLALITASVLLVIMGNMMPKLKKNRFIGLRTSWSMANEAVWQKSQRLGGYITIAFGLAMLLCAAFLSGTAALIALLIAAPVWAAACILGSRRIYKRETAEKGE